MRKSLRVAVVGDEEDDYLLLGRLLASEPAYDMQAEWIRDFGKAAQQILQSDFHLVFLDYKMAHLSGISRPRDLPVVMGAGYANSGMERAAMHAGVDY